MMEVVSFLIMILNIQENNSDYLLMIYLMKRENLSILIKVPELYL